MTGVEESGWMSQLSRLLQLAGAVADLMDVQGSSVLVCLEDGWDNTAQVQYRQPTGDRVCISISINVKL